METHLSTETREGKVGGFSAYLHSQRSQSGIKESKAELNRIIHPIYLGKHSSVWDTLGNLTDVLQNFGMAPLGKKKLYLYLFCLCVRQQDHFHLCPRNYKIQYCLCLRNNSFTAFFLFIENRFVHTRSRMHKKKHKTLSGTSGHFSAALLWH